LLLPNDRDGYTVWQRAADRGNLEALEKLWVWAKEVGQNTEELFLGKSIRIKTAW